MLAGNSVGQELAPKFSTVQDLCCTPPVWQDLCRHLTTDELLSPSWKGVD